MTEVWTDVFKLYTRRVLVQRISPVCSWYKQICDKNVKAVHVIHGANRFIKKLDGDIGDPEREANQQLAHLVANNCQLANQFRLAETIFRVMPENMDVVRHCMDLFQGCQIVLHPGPGVKMDARNIKWILEHLDLLEATKPARVFAYLSYRDPPMATRTINVQQDQVAALQFIEFLRHPTIWHCNRVKIEFSLELQCASVLSIFELIFEWLHHSHSMDGGGEQPGIRCLIFRSYQLGEKEWEGLLNRCVQDFQQSRGPAGRRPFVFSFACPPACEFLKKFARIENPSTGEVLVFDRVNGGLRRCLAQEGVDGEDFYAKMFKQYYDWDYDDDSFSPVFLCVE